MCSHKLTAGTYRNYYSELALSLIPSLLSHRLLRAAWSLQKPLCMKSQGPGLTLLCGASLSGPVCLSLQTRWGGGVSSGLQLCPSLEEAVLGRPQRASAPTRPLERRGFMVTEEVLPPRARASLSPRGCTSSGWKCSLTVLGPAPLHPRKWEAP